MKEKYNHAILRNRFGADVTKEGPPIDKENAYCNANGTFRFYIVGRV